MSEYSIFNPDEFLNSQRDESLDDEYTPVPPGEYLAAIEKVEARSGVSERTGEPWAGMNITWRIMAPDSDLADGRTVRQSMFLDINESGGLANGPNKNVQLGKVLSALGLKGKAWSPKGLEHQTAKVRVTNREGEGRYEGQVFSEVSQVGVAA